MNFFRANTRLSSSSLFFVVAFFLTNNAWAFPNFKASKDSKLPAVLKADTVDGDQINKTLVANGNVELSKGSSVVYADQMTYDKNGGLVRAIGHVKIKNIEVGNVTALQAEIKDDFSSGKFFDSKIVFIDGSYLTSPEIDRQTPSLTVLQKPTYSICPNPEIGADNELAGKKRDLVSIKSSSTTIDRENEVMRSRGGIFRFYNVPFFYTPFLQIPLASKKKQSGFLPPSYANSTNLGFGIKTPYYSDIAPNIDLTTTPFIGISSSQILVTNELRHITSYGDYKANLEIANNKITNGSDSNVVKRTDAQYRWAFGGSGVFDFTKNTGLDFNANTLGDRNYSRDYYNNYQAYTMSRVNLDYINTRSYHAVKTIRFQELEYASLQHSAPLILPTIDSHIETVPLGFKEKFALTSNATVLTRGDGLQYRRASFVPEVNAPLNLHGNLFNANAKVQGDFYSLNNSLPISQRTNEYDNTQTNYKPEMSLSWRLPLIKKRDKSTFLVEPMINLVTSYYHTNYIKSPNEDSNSSELSVSNLFVNDRISGFDRNEIGKRMSYGIKSSLFNSYGEFGLTLGQSYRKGGKTQDVAIRGFNNNNKSNIVGQAMYKAAKYITITYAFQLDESNYRNDVNQISTALNFDQVTFTSDFLLLRRSKQNLQQREQLGLSSAIKLTDRWKVNLAMTRDLVNNRNLSRSLMLYRDGCCTVFGFSVTEFNPSTLNKAQQTFNLNLSFKNL
jgi:LPS-assembly protein